MSQDHLMSESVATSDPTPSAVPERKTPEGRRRITTLAWVAFGLSVLVAFGLWVFWAAAATGDISDHSALLWSEPWRDIAGYFMLVGVFGLLPAIVLCI